MEKSCLHLKRLLEALVDNELLVELSIQKDTGCLGALRATWSKNSEVTFPGVWH